MKSPAVTGVVIACDFLFRITVIAWLLVLSYEIGALKSRSVEKCSAISHSGVSDSTADHSNRIPPEFWPNGRKIHILDVGEEP